MQHFKIQTWQLNMILTSGGIKVFQMTMIQMILLFLYLL